MPIGHTTLNGHLYRRSDVHSLGLGGGLGGSLHIQQRQSHMAEEAGRCSGSRGTRELGRSNISKSDNNSQATSYYRYLYL